ncbi:MAG TPA: hypothetical protein VFW73_09595 [Lacipirellulaceae bacterium]|nr:hypothetical protein [Lacipirellulaceae bacterium]
MVEREESRRDDWDRTPDDRVVRERVQELTWDLLDERITDDEFRLLENLLLSDQKPRDTYLGCVQLQADLMSHFRGDAVGAGPGSHTKPEVLGFLNVESPPFGFQAPSADEAAQ